MMDMPKKDDDWKRHCDEYQQDIEMLALAMAKKIKEEKEKDAKN